MNIPSFLIRTYDKEKNFCIDNWPKQQLWLAKAYSTLWFVVAGIVPITVMSVLYSRVVYNLWFKRSEHQVQGTQLAVLKSRKRVTKMLVIVSVVYVLCMPPNLTLYLLHHYGTQHIYINVIHISGIVLVVCNSAINPFIYAFQSGKFRRHLNELVCCRKLRKNRVTVFVQPSTMDTAPINSLQIERQLAEHSV
jgi:hypothetical protein